MTIGLQKAQKRVQRNFKKFPSPGDFDFSSKFQQILIGHFKMNIQVAYYLRKFIISAIIDR